MRIVLLGGPGSGKGTQGNLLAQKRSIPLIATGDILRAETAAKSPLGLRAQQYMGGGSLVPDELVLSMMEQRLSEPDAANGFVVDGFPRSIPQAEGFEKILRKLSARLDVVVKLDLPKKVLLARLTSRWWCPQCAAVYNTIAHPPRTAGICDNCGGKLAQRDDDTPETAKRRLSVYETTTVPLIDYYDARGLLIIVDGDGTVAEVADRVESALDDMGERRTKP